MSALNNSALIGASGSAGYQISRSVRLRSSASAYFNRTQSTPTDEKKFTLSAWVKRGILSTQQAIFGGRDNATGQTPLQFTSGNAISWGDSDGVSTFYTGTTAAVFRDPSAWYHIVSVYDSNNATAADRLIIYVNGVRQTITITGSGSSIPLSRAGYWNQSGTVVEIGRTNNDPSTSFDGYITEAYFIDGQALTPSSFGETNTTTGVWQPKKYAGTYGTNGFYLNFSDNSGVTATTIGKDYSGNGNNWTPNNISVTAGVTYDSMLDVPTQWADGGNGRGNYCTLNRLDEYGTIGQMGCNSGNLISSPGGATTNKGFLTTVGINVGMTAYAEATFTTTSGDNNGGVAVTPQGNANPGDTATSMRWGDAGFIRTNNVGTAYGSALVTNDVVMMAVNYESATSCKVWIGKNGTWFASGNPATGANPSVTLNPAAVTMFIASYHFANLAVSNWTFGQRPFAYTPPTGFKALNTLNLPEPTILKGNQYFDVNLWAGTGATLPVINSGGMQPDFVWVKTRTNLYNHALFDSVRGVNKTLASNATDAEVTQTQGLLSFNSNGFTLGTSSDSTVNNAGSGQTYVGWQWKANGTPAVTNTAGSITSQVSVGANQGFSIVTYTGTGANATVGHGLGVAPKMLIVKGRDSAGSWAVYHANANASPASGRLYLQATNAFTAQATAWNSTAPSSTVFSVGSLTDTNQSANKMVAYCFSEVAGFSKFGSYTGNGSADGPFVFCGFRPRFIMIKRTDSTADWHILDTARDTYNVAGNVLYPNLSAAESGVVWTDDILSNGFKIRITGAAENASGGTYIFAAFAENPFKNALAR